MEKTYLLLRNNKQLGPFTIDELLQQQIKSSDLIWVEGHSTSWSAPSTIEELDQEVVYIKKIKKEKKAPIRVVEQQSIPKPKVAELEQEQNLEKRAEALRDRILLQQHQNPARRDEVFSELQKAHGYLKEPQIPVSFHNRKTYFSLPQLLAAGVLTAVIGTAFYSGWTPVKSNSHVTNAAVVPLNTTESNAAKAALPANPVAQQPNLDSVASVRPTASGPMLQQKTTIKSGTDTAVQLTQNMPATAALAQAEKPVATEPAKENTTEKTITASTEVGVKDEQKETTQVETTEEPKKKGFLRNLFKKKKKDREDAVVE